MMRNASGFYSFHHENSTFKNTQSSMVENRQFILTESDELIVKKLNN